MQRISIEKVSAALATAFLLTAAPGDGHAQASFDCVIDPARIVKLGSPVVGLLEEVLVKRGDHVIRGEVIARMEDEVETVAVAYHTFRAADTAEIEAQTARLALSRKQLERASKLYERKAVSAQRIDELRAEVEVHERELARVQMQRNLAQIELRRSKALLDKRAIRSPIDGIVTQRHLSPGEFMHQEAHVVTLAKLDPLHIEAFLPVALHSRIAVGMLATVHPEAPVEGQYAAKITVVDQVFDSPSGTFGVRLEMANPDSRLPGGHRCKVVFPIEASGRIRQE